MPAYKNRVSMDPATELRRYITLDTLKHTLQKLQLRLTRVDKWDDEGKIVEFKVMIRPLKAINPIHPKMAAMLVKQQAGT